MTKGIEDELADSEFGNPLRQYHRDAMLDLILAWGTLDGALTIMVAAFTKEDLYDTAARLGKTSGQMKLHEIAKLLKATETTKSFGAKFSKLKRNYERKSILRNRIAHGHCVGFLLSDPNYIVFAVPEPEGERNLAIEAIHTDSMIAATSYGNSLTAFASQVADQLRSA